MVHLDLIDCVECTLCDSRTIVIKERELTIKEIYKNANEFGNKKVERKTINIQDKLPLGVDFPEIEIIYEVIKQTTNYHEYNLYISVMSSKELFRTEVLFPKYYLHQNKNSTDAEGVLNYILSKEKLIVGQKIEIFNENYIMNNEKRSHLDKGEDVIKVSLWYFNGGCIEIEMPFDKFQNF